MQGGSHDAQLAPSAELTQARKMPILDSFNAQPCQAGSWDMPMPRFQKQAGWEIMPDSGALGVRFCQPRFVLRDPSQDVGSFIAASFKLKTKHHTEPHWPLIHSTKPCSAGDNLDIKACPAPALGHGWVRTYAQGTFQLANMSRSHVMSCLTGA